MDEETAKHPEQRMGAAKQQMNAMTQQMQKQMESMRDLIGGDISILVSRSSAELDAGIFRVPVGYRQRDILQ